MNARELISDLISDGMKQAEISQKIQLSQSVISDLLNGKAKDVRWSTGERLRKLHAERISRIDRASTDRNQEVA